MRMTRIALLGSALILLQAACGGLEPPGRAGDPGSSDGHGRWLAVLETAADPNDLDAATRDVLETAKEATVVSPAWCFASTPDGPAVPEHHYVLGVVARSEEALARVVAATGREPVFTGEVVDTCEW
jgi:hypothetical protein